jgi:hypothetical protein
MHAGGPVGLALEPPYIFVPKNFFSLDNLPVLTVRAFALPFSKLQGFMRKIEKYQDASVDFFSIACEFLCLSPKKPRHASSSRRTAVCGIQKIYKYFNILYRNTSGDKKIAACAKQRIILNCPPGFLWATRRHARTMVRNF